MPKTKLVKCKYCNKIIKYEDSYKTIYYNKYFRHYCSKEHQYYIENFQRHYKMGRWLLGKNKMPQDFINKGLSYYNE